MRNLRDPLKVLFVSHSSGLGGSERSLLLLLKNINRRHFEPIVVLPESGQLHEEIRYLGIKTYTVKYMKWVCKETNIIILGHRVRREIMALPKFLNIIIKKEKINVVYTNTIVVFSGAISAFVARIPHIWHIREIITNDLNLHFFLPNKFLFNLILMLSRGLIAASNAVASQFSVKHWDKKLKIIPNAVDYREFEGFPSSLNINGVKQEDWLVGVVGYLEERKAQDVAISAIKIAKQKIPKVRLLIIGEGDEEFKNHLKKLSFESNISDKVVFTGYRNDVPKILSHCKVLLMPSLEEGFGRVAIEAMAAGIPVIGVNSGAIPEIVRDGETGYLVPPKSPQKTAEKLIKLYNHPKLIKKLGNKGKEIARQKYAPEIYAGNIEKFIIQTISN